MPSSSPRRSISSSFYFLCRPRPQYARGARKQRTDRPRVARGGDRADCSLRTAALGAASARWPSRPSSRGLRHARPGADATATGDSRAARRTVPGWCQWRRVVRPSRHQMRLPAHVRSPRESQVPARRLRNHTRFPFQLGQRPTWCARASHLFFSPLKIRLLWREPLVSAPRGSRPPRCPPRGRRAAPWWRAARASPRTPSGLGTPSASRQLAELQMAAARHHTRHCARHTLRALLARGRRGAPTKPWVGQPARHACMLALVLPIHTALATGHRAAKAERFPPVLRCSAKCLWSMQWSEVITF